MARDFWLNKKNKIRTIITVIGVLWGIFIYVVLSGAAKGLDNGFERQFSNVAIILSLFGLNQQVFLTRVLKLEGFLD